MFFLILNYAALQIQTVVSAYFTSKKILTFGFARQYTALQIEIMQVARLATAFWLCTVA